MNNNTPIKGFKVFNSDWTCRNYQYTCPGIFEEDVIPSVCDKGFHFCTNAADCFNYYSFNPNNKVAEVIALGEVVSRGDKSCTNKIQIVREIPWSELLEIVNTGKGCSGLCNSGNRNSGDWNSGNRNSGNRNSGDCNSGDCNSGDWNSGDWNSGNRNSGNRNSGDWNSGNRNSGDWNSGDCNSGDCNSGDWNSGDWNSGNRNSGNRNSGDWNSGNRNSGNRNSGDWNSGDWNKTNFSNGCFNTAEPTIFLFNKPSDWTFSQWRSSDACWVLSSMPFSGSMLEYVYFEDMSEKEKAEHPEAATTGGYLKILKKDESRQIWWDGLSDRSKKIVMSLPNFDKSIFEEITGIKA